MILEYKRLRPDVVEPVRAYPSDAGLDVFFNPPEAGSVGLEHGENHLFHTGISIAVPHGYALMVCNKSGVASKVSLVYGAHVIDPGYEGEIFIDLHNIGRDTVVISPGDKIAQLVLVPCVHFGLVERDNPFTRVIAIGKERGDGGFGSTG